MTTLLAIDPSSPGYEAGYSIGYALGGLFAVVIFLGITVLVIAAIVLLVALCIKGIRAAAR